MPGELKVLTSRHLPELLALVDRDPVAHCFVASRLADPMDPWALGGLVWGWFEVGSPALGDVHRRQPDPDRDHPPGACVLRRQRPAAGPSLLLPRGPRRRGARPVAPARACVGAGSRGALHAVPDGHRRPRHAPRAPGAARPAHATSSTCSCPRRSPCSPRRWGCRRWPTAAGRPTAPGWPRSSGPDGPWAWSRRGASSSRPRSGPPPHAPARSRVSGSTRPCAGAGSASPGWPPSSSTPAAHIAPIVSLYVNDYNHVAVGTYLRVGFQTVGTFATVLF